MNKGKPFTDVKADFVPQDEDYPIEASEVPVFSEAFLYPTVGKGDARFVLGVAEEYEHIIKALGPAATIAILTTRPRLVQRLELPEKIIDWLEDARDERSVWLEEEHPSQVILDHDAARVVWRICHNEYRRHYEPEKTLEKDMLRAYNALTDGLGPWYQKERQKEQERLPEKLAKRDEARAKRERQEKEATPT